MQNPVSARVQGALLFLIGVAVYLPALSHGFIWDDYPHIIMNGLLPRPDGLSRIWFHLEFQQYLPIQLTTHWIEYHLWGTHPLGYHAVNITLHATVGFLLWRVLVKLEFPWAWVAAAVFLVHPVNAETAAYVTERRNLLSAIFYLLAVLCWLRFEAREEKRWYAAALGFFLFGLLSKTVVCSLPLVLLLLRWMRGLPIGGRQVLQIVPFFVIALPLALLTAFMERYLIGANGYEWAFSIPQRILICGHALWFYAAKDVWPANLMFFYPRWNIDTTDWSQWLYVIGAVLLVLSLIPLTRYFGRRPATALLYFGLTIFPALGFANVYPHRFSFVANHFQYLATIGIITLGVGILHAGYQRVLATNVGLREAAYLPLLASAALPAALTIVLWNYLPSLKDDNALYADILSKNDDCWIAHANTGVTLYDHGDYAAAAHHFEIAHRLVPHETEVMNNLGKCYERLGRAADARRTFEAGIADSPALEMIAKAKDRDNFIAGKGFLNVYEVHRIIATMEMQLGLARLDVAEKNWDSAESHLRQAAELRPQSPKPVLARAEWLAAQGKLTEALAACDRAATLKPESGQPFVLKAELYMRNSASGAAAVEQVEAAYREALRREPTNIDANNGLCEFLLAHHKAADAEAVVRAALTASTPSVQLQTLLARALQAKGDLNAAAQAYKSALELDPQNLKALSGFAGLCLQANQDKAAEALLREALKIAPDSTSERENLGIALAKQGRFDEAIATLQECRAKSPSLTVDLNLKRVLLLAGRFGDATTLLRELLANPKLSAAEQLRTKRDLAWLLATCPDEKVRNGADALKLAQELFGQLGTDAKDAELVDALSVLAAAQAETGDYTSAVKSLQQASAKLTAPEQQPLLQQFTERQKLYAAGKPWRGQ